MKNIKSKFKKFFNKVLNIFFPEKLKCIFCSDDVPNFDEKPYCEECESVIPFNNGHKCKICDMEILGQGEVCDFCKKNKRDFDRAYSPFKYENEVRKVVLNFKSKNAKYLAEPMARMMLKDMPESMKNFDLIIPVPSSQKTIKERGYNQSELLAREIGRITGIEVNSEILIKHKETQAQKELSFSQRKNNLKDAFKLISRKELKDKNILLVDDVMTTCATANLCGSLLKRHCNKVYVVVFARNTIKSIKK